VAGGGAARHARGERVPCPGVAGLRNRGARDGYPRAVGRSARAGRAPNWHAVGRVAIGWALVAAALLGAAAAIRYLSPPDGSIGAVVVAGRVDAGPRRGERVTLVRDGQRWVTDAADVPPGSVVHVRPTGFPGFFLLRARSGRVWAVADRNTHRGQAIWWQDPLRQWERDHRPPKAGFASWDGDFTPEGAVLWGPPPRPLDAFPTEAIGRRIAVAVTACGRGVDVPPFALIGPGRLLHGCRPDPPLTQLDAMWG